MATIQGMCKNCGALIVFDDRNEKCECVFCNCVFPSSEAIEIFNNPNDYTFANEKFEPTGEDKHLYSTRVFSDEGLEKAIKRDELARATKANGTAVKNEFEISPNDVKAPAKLVWGSIIALCVLIILVIVIGYPMRNSRIEATKKVSDNINQVFDGVLDVNTTLDNGKTSGYIIYGQTCQNIKFVTDDAVNSENAETVYRNYSAVRSDALGRSEDLDKAVDMLIYASNGIFEVSYNGSEVLVSEK